MSRVVSPLRRMPRAFAILLGAATLAFSAAIILPTPMGTRASAAAGVRGAAYAWGSNAYGQLGNGTVTSSSIPVSVSLPSGTVVTAIAGGQFFSLALTSTGGVLAWGANYAGQLGNGTTANSTTPVQVSLPSATIVTAIAAGGHHALAVTSTGQVFAWGFNFDGEVGNGTTNIGGCSCVSTPVAAHLPNGTIVTAVAAGFYHSMALTSSGQVLAWGSNLDGQLGDNTFTDSTAPIFVRMASGTVATAIAAGESHSLALTSGGAQVLVWGNNLHGQLGNGTTSCCVSVATAVSLPAATTVTAIAAGGCDGLALTSTGKVLAWGCNASGQLGNGTTTESSSPVQVSLPSGTTATAIAGDKLLTAPTAPAGHSLALTSTGRVLAWGSNAAGQLGNGTTTNSSIRVVATAVQTAMAIAGGGLASLAIQLPAVAVFPAMANGAYGGYVTAATIQNTGIDPANVRILYFDQNGAPVGNGDYMSSLPVNASWTVRQDNGNSFPASGGNAVQAGSAIVYSSEPIASFVNEFAPGNAGDATSYTGVQLPSGVGATLYAPTIANNAYGGHTTRIGLLNQGSSPTDVTITYRDGAGSVIKTQSVAGLAAHAYYSLYSGDATLALPSGFAGTATITSSATQPLGAIVNETGPGGQFSSYDAVAVGSTTLNVPVALNNAFGGYYTGMAIQNTTASIGTVYVTYYDALGAATAKSFPIQANGSLGLYQGSPTDGPAVGAYTAVIRGSSVSLAAIVNEVAPSSTSAKQSTSYNTFSSGSNAIHLALVENTGSDPWNTGEGIMNTGTGSTTVTVSYFDAFDGTFIGPPQTQTLASHAFWGLYQPTGGLPSGR